MTGKESGHCMNAQGNSVLSLVWLHEMHFYVHVDTALHAALDSQVRLRIVTSCVFTGVAFQSSSI